MTGEPDDAAAEAVAAGPRRPAIEVDGVSVAYGDAPVLEGVDATVAAGELVGLVGPNGAGKTTLLRTISGVLEPDSGRVRVHGDDVRALSSAAASRRVAVLPQETSTSFSFSVRQLVEMGRHPHRGRFERPTAEDLELVEAAMERTRTAQFADRSIADVSGGERQRVLLARALAQDAPVLLLDEPTSDLDLHHAAETMALVRELVGDDRTAVAAIHDLELAARFCDRLLMLSGGEIVAAGEPADVLASERIEEAFGGRAVVEPEPVGGGVAVRALPEAEPGPRVHVVGGGEAAAAAIGELASAGAECSLGPVPAGDRAVATAGGFDAEVVTTPRFEAPGEEEIRRACELARESAAVVVAVPDGLEPAWERVCEAGAGVVVLDGDGSGAAEAGSVERDELPEAVADVASEAVEAVTTQGEGEPATALRLTDGGRERSAWE